MTNLIFCNDSGNSAAKIIAYDVLHPMQPTIFTMDSFAHPFDGNATPGNIYSSALELPVRGVYGVSARQHGAQYHKKPQYTGDIHKLLKFGALADALEQIVPDEQDVTIQVWVEGFPATHIHSGVAVQEMLLNGGEPLAVKKDGRPPVNVTVNRVITQSQPYFIIIDQVFQWEGNRLTDTRGKMLFQQGAVLLIDWGASSIDIALATSSLKEIKADCSMRGTISFLSELRAMAFAKAGDTIPDYELMQVFKCKKLMWHGKEYDFSDEVGALITALIPTIISRTDTFLKQYTDDFAPYTLLLGGGGAIHAEMALREAFNDRFVDNGGIHLIQDDNGNPETVLSVARGMAKRGFIAWKEHV